MGGLDEEEDLPAVGLDDEEFLFDREEVEVNILVSFQFYIFVSIVITNLCSIGQEQLLFVQKKINLSLPNIVLKTSLLEKF